MSKNNVIILLVIMLLNVFTKTINADIAPDVIPSKSSFLPLVLIAVVVIIVVILLSKFIKR